MRGRSLVGAAAAVALTACGVQPQDDVEPVPTHQLPPELRTQSDAPQTAGAGGVPALPSAPAP